MIDVTTCAVCSGDGLGVEGFCLTCMGTGGTPVFGKNLFLQNLKTQIEDIEGKLEDVEEVIDEIKDIVDNL